MNKEEQVIRANNANAIINNEEFINAFTSLRDAYQKALFETEWEQTEQREELYKRIVILDKVRSNLMDVIIRGNIAKDDIDWLQRINKEN